MSPVDRLARDGRCSAPPLERALEKAFDLCRNVSCGPTTETKKGGEAMKFSNVELKLLEDSVEFYYSNGAKGQELLDSLVMLARRLRDCQKKRK